MTQDQWDSWNFHGPTFRGTFDYVVVIERPSPGVFVLHEARQGLDKPIRTPLFPATDGLAGIGLILAPGYADDYRFTCQGRAKQHGQPAWRVDFEQLPDHPVRIWAFHVEGKNYAGRLKGRAWISADSYDLLRVETDLMQPLPEAGLVASHMAIDYAPIQFRQRLLRLWLPATAEISLLARGMRDREYHTFSDFKLFSVDVLEKPGTAPQG